MKITFTGEPAKIEAIMSTNVATVNIDDNLHLVRDIFHKLSYHHLVVVDCDRLAGVISDRDFLKAVSPNLDTQKETLVDQASLNKKVSQIMTKTVVAVNKDLQILTASKLMLSKGVSCLPIATEDKKVIGIVTLKDVLKYYIDNDQSDLLTNRI